MKKRLGIATAIAAIAVFAVLGLTREGETQPAGTPARLVVGIYTPTVQFAGSQARVAYVNRLASAIASNTGTVVTGKSFTSMTQLRRSKVDFAIMPGQCYASNRAGKLLANAKVKGRTSRKWALYSSQGKRMAALKGKKLAYIKTGCNDTGFIENAMLESEVGLSWFSGKVGMPDLGASVAAVVSRKSAQAVFTPLGAQKGLTKVFDTGSVPNPAFVQLNTKLPKSLSGKVAKAVIGFGGGGAISGWGAANAGSYRSLRGRMGRRIKRGVFASPSPVRFNDKDVLIWPKTLGDTDLTVLKQHFHAPPERQE